MIRRYRAAVIGVRAARPAATDILSDRFRQEARRNDGAVCSGAGNAKAR